MFSLAWRCTSGSNIVAIDFCSYLSFSHCFNDAVPIPSGVGTVSFLYFSKSAAKTPVLFPAYEPEGGRRFLYLRKIYGKEHGYGTSVKVTFASESPEMEMTFPPPDTVPPARRCPTL